MLYVSLGFWDAIKDLFRKSEPEWDKTKRRQREERYE